MSILIKGMEMPKSCKDCQLHELAIINATPVYFCKCLPNIKVMPIEEKRTDCPLVELPPHGELIDRDALNNAFTCMRFDADGFLLHYGDREDWYLKGAEVETLITNATTIIEAERGEE